MISVIIPIYNAERYIHRAVQSVLNQTYKDYEIILVDDCSTDSSLDVCMLFDDSVKVVAHARRKGVGAARNRGMEIAKGDQILFLDADDTLLPHSLKTLISHKGNSQITIGGVYRIYESGDYCAQGVQFHPMVLYPDGISRRVFDYLSTGNDHVVSHCWGRLYDHIFLKAYKIRFPEGVKVGEDGAFNIKCLAFASQVSIVGDPIYCFTIHPASSSAIAVNSGEMDLSALKDSLKQFFAKRVDLFISGLSIKTVEWGKSNVG